ncbi:hypothetical protein I6N90_01385 [Paenibacillus sp. GSMTC-2017]|uniref:hypothetical protein n=1 Tax=Paenibacillus sp. GSMTC-2017 TaxID=2794350 RepID=UPI0018D80DFA|nr:hypothetical protein [Paenibacillus sp. GSMTC-2017]MBH5316457.1 hypothetical protein [Paenibacillus sp. GSMTC-2017]
MDIQLGVIHFVYLSFVVAIIGFMLMRRDTTLICIAGILGIGILATTSIAGSVSGIFNSFIYAIKELIGTILIISVIVALSRILIRTGINEIMIAPLTRFMKTPTLAYWGIGIIMMITSLFFWPSPAVALVGAVLLPVAIRVGLPALGAAVAMNLFGHGIALSGDYIIQGAPQLTADAAGLQVNEVMQASIPLVIVMGVVTTVVAFWMMKRDLRTGKWNDGLIDGASNGINQLASEGDDGAELSHRTKQILAVIIPLLFAANVATMLVLNLQGGDATALIGGTSIQIMLIVTMMTHRGKGLEKATSYLIDGFLFGFRVFGPVIPIAAFFYLGDSGFFAMFGEKLPEASHGIVNDLGVALAHVVPVNGVVGSITLTIGGAITGLDGSGFSGISLAGSIAQLFGHAIGSGIATLTALGQVAAIWVGGGTIIAWALIPAAAICGVSPFELARRNLKPVLIGLIVTTIVAMFLI